MSRLRYARLIPFPVLFLLTLGCGLFGADDGPPPPPPVNTGVTPPAVTPAQPGMSVVSITAASTPPGATVTGGGQPLGVTPLTTQVPAPTAQPGQAPQTFDFVFSKEGFDPMTIQAAPVNGMIVITATLLPAGTTPTADPAGDPTPTTETEAGAPGRVVEVTGGPGGRIFDSHTTTSRATVEEDCVIASARITVRGNHTFHRDLRVRIEPPEGRTVMLQNLRNSNPFRRYTPSSLEGRQARGEWVLKVTDAADQDSGQLRPVRLRFECR
ncbi:MAG: hypothetical protein DRJ42_16940 [Deltaproteobacteria bacterium]|nr:MAG: hypothetical protein DRJ42_16940 [Deltaproteobacteria bacterium]